MFQLHNKSKETEWSWIHCTWMSFVDNQISMGNSYIQLKLLGITGVMLGEWSEFTFQLSISSKYRLQTGYEMQTADWVPNVDWKF